MFNQALKIFNQKIISKYHIGVGLSLLSAAFGVLREFVIVALLGLGARNDQLQIYLSIFYSVSLSNDAIKLGVLNMCNYASLRRIFFAATIVGLPYSVLIGIIFWFISGSLSFNLLLVAIVGSFLNLIMILLVTYKQRYGAFLSALSVNVSPNFILIPGILLIYLFLRERGINYIIYLYAILPLLQILWLLCIKTTVKEELGLRQMSLLDGMKVFLKQGISTVGEQFFQVILRSCLFRFSAGYLSLFSIFMRAYSAAKFIFIDTYIGSKIGSWGMAKNSVKTLIDYLIGKDVINIFMVLFALGCSYSFKGNLVFFAIQLGILLLLGFYFDTLLRIVYYKINSYQHNARLIIGMGVFDGVFAFLVFLISRFSFFFMIPLVWIWYVARLYLKILYYRKYEYAS